MKPDFERKILRVTLDEETWLSATLSATDETTVKKESFPVSGKLFLKVGAARFELTTSWSQTKRDTGLRYAPKYFVLLTPNNV